MDIDKKVILNLLDEIGGDGHTLWGADADFFKGVPKEIMDSVTHTHKSDGTGKGSIFVNGEVVEELHGVYGLDILWRLAKETGSDTTHAGGMFGRGSQARALTQAIREKLGGADNV
jgi:hypothetical protein